MNFSTDPKKQIMWWLVFFFLGLAMGGALLDIKPTLSPYTGIGVSVRTKI